MWVIDAFIDENGKVHLLERVHLSGRCRAIVTILDPDGRFDRGTKVDGLAEASLAQDWNRPEEEAAWSHLQPD